LSAGPQLVSDIVLTLLSWMVEGELELLRKGSGYEDIDLLIVDEVDRLKL
jgi:hypothetical protein